MSYVYVVELFSQESRGGVRVLCVCVCCVCGCGRGGWTGPGFSNGHCLGVVGGWELVASLNAGSLHNFYCSIYIGLGSGLALRLFD